MADGALSMLAMPAAGLLAGGPPPRRGEIVLGGRLLCYRPYRCADGWISVGRAGAEVLGRVLPRRRTARISSSTSSTRPGPTAHAAVEAIAAARTRAEWDAFNAEHDCCVEPVLELDEALADEQVRVRAAWSPDGLLGNPGEAVRDAPRPAVARRRGSASTPTRCSREAGYDAGEIAALRAAGAVK